MTYFTHIHGEINAVTECDYFTYRLRGGFTSVSVTGIHQFIIVFRVCEWLEISIPLRTTDKDNMIVINFSDGSYRTFMKRLQFAIQIIHILKIWGDWLIYKFISKYYRLILVIASNFLPDITE